MKKHKESIKRYSFIKMFTGLGVLFFLFNTLSYGITLTEEEQKKKDTCKCSDEVEKARGDEIKRIKCWLKCVERDPIEGEKVLFTWGHQNKINDMKSLTKDLYYAKDYARQNKREEASFRKTYQKSTKKELLSAKNVSDLLVDLISLQNSKGGSVGDVPLEIAAMNKLYPGYIDNLKKDPKQELKDKLKEFKRICEGRTGTPSETCVKLDGEIIGLKTSSSTAASMRDSSAGSGQVSSGSTGKGVYMDNTLRYVNHFPDEGGGLACRTDGLKVINLNPNTPEGKTNYHILQKVKIMLESGMAGPIYNPTQYNIWVAPDVLEEAISGYILDFATMNPIIVSKKAIDFSTTAGRCRDILITDFPEIKNSALDCKEEACLVFDSLMSSNTIKKKGLLFMLIGSFDRTQHDKQIAHMAKLINKSGKKCTYVKNLLDTITLDQILLNIFTSGTSKTSLEAMKTDCGCNVKEGKIVCTKQ